MIRRLEFWALRIAAIVVTGTLVYTIGVKHGENQPTTTADLELGLTVAPETPCDLPRPRSFRVAVIHALPSIPHYDRDHRVPWQEAMQSGLCDRTDAERRAFYNDISNLWPIPSSVNRSKGDGDFAEWTPLCWYARRYRATKRKYDLTVDAKEAHALRAALDTCA